MNMQLTTLPAPGEGPQTMSSLEIAELLGKRHDHVMRDIRNMLEQLEIDQSTFGAVYRDAKGEERPCYNLPRTETMILVTGYSIPLRAKVVRRWEELEAQLQARIPSRQEALRLAADYLDRAEAAERASKI